MSDAAQILSDILGERKIANPSYSLRAFARDLGLSPPQLSNVINGHRGLSPKVVQKVLAVLALDPTQEQIFVNSLQAKFSPSQSQRLVAKAKIAYLNDDLKTRYLDSDLFKVVSNWHHFALLELI